MTAPSPLTCPECANVIVSADMLPDLLHAREEGRCRLLAPGMPMLVGCTICRALLHVEATVTARSLTDAEVARAVTHLDVQKGMAQIAEQHRTHGVPRGDR